MGDEETPPRASPGGYGFGAFKFSAEQEGELSFDVGEVVRVHGEVDAEWQEGTLVANDEKGIFPAAFVSALEFGRAVDDFAAEQDSDLGFKKGDTIVVVRRVDEAWLEGTRALPSASKLGMFPREFIEMLPPPKGPWAKVTDPFTAEGDGEMSLYSNDVVHLTGRIDADWLTGICCGESGMFPEAFVRVGVAWKEATTSDHEPLPELPTDEDEGTTQQHDSLPDLPPEDPPEPPTPDAVPDPAPQVADVVKKPPPVAAKSRPPVTPKPRPPSGDASSAVERHTPAPSPSAPTVESVKQEPSPLTTTARANPKPPPPARPPQKKAPPPKPSVRPPPSNPGSQRTPPPKPSVKPPKPARKSEDTSECTPSSPIGGSKPAKPQKPTKPHSSSNLAVSNHLGKQPVMPARRASASVKRKPATPSRPNSMVDSIRTEGGPAVRVSMNLEAEIDLLEKEIVEATDKERGCMAMLEHLSKDPDADSEAVAVLEQQLQAAKGELDIMEADLIHKQSKRDQRAKVVAEMFDTEDDLATDLKLCIRGYCQSDSPLRRVVSEADFEMLFCNIEDVAAMALRLSQALRHESLKPVSEQAIGNIFCKYAPSLQEVYVKYVVNFDDSNELQIRLSGDGAVTAALKTCHAQVVAKTKCWDLANFLIKPVQRVLKYPLLLRELQKRTPDDHPDYPQILQASEEVTKIATAINEGKRTKELLGKYTEKRDKLNPHGMIHSLAKKSMRLNQRLRDRVGGRDDDKFEQFDTVAKDFQSLELLCKRLQQRTEDYLACKSRSALALKEVVAAARTALLFKDFKSTQSALSEQAATASQRVLTAFKKIETYMLTFVKEIQKNGDAIGELMQCFVNPNKLIAKRAHKKLDAESYQRKYQALAKDPERQRALKTDVSLAENNFQALNKQLEEDLPRLVDLSQATLVSILKALAKVEYNFGCQCIAACLEAMPDSADGKSPNTHRGEHRARLTVVVQSMLDSQNMFDFKDLARDFGGLMPQRGPTVSMRRRSSSQDFNASQHPSSASVLAAGTNNGPSGDTFANAVCQWDYTSETDAEVTLAEGEKVVVLSRSDNTGNSDWCKVRKVDGSEGFVPSAFLTEVASDVVIVVDEAEPTDDDLAEIAAFSSILCVADVIFDFEGEATIELSVVAGERLDVLATEDLTGNDEWCLVQNATGTRGFVPKSFVAFDSAEETQPPSARSVDVVDHRQLTEI